MPQQQPFPRRVLIGFAVGALCCLAGVLWAHAVGGLYEVFVRLGLISMPSFAAAGGAVALFLRRGED
jgi:hypothetical protein